MWTGVVTGERGLLQVIINFNALPWLLNLLSSSKKGIRKEACWTISNITAGNKEQIQAVIEANIIPPLIELLSNAEFDIRKVRFTLPSDFTVSSCRVAMLRYGVPVLYGTHMFLCGRKLRNCPISAIHCPFCTGIFAQHVACSF